MQSIQIFPLTLCGVQRRIGFSKKRVSVVDQAICNCHANSGCNRVLYSVKCKRALHYLNDFRWYQTRGFRLIQSFGDGDKLVARQSRQHIGLAHTSMYPHAELFEQRVATGMPWRVADLLEAVNIEIQASHFRAVAVAACNRVGETIVKIISVWQAGQ